MTTVRRLLGQRDGTAAIEFAVVLPLMIALAAGIVELGRAFQVYNAVNRLATQYAIAYSDCSDFPVGTCGAEILLYGDADAVKNIVPQLDYAGLTLSLFQISMNGTTPNVTYAYPSGATLTAAQRTAAQAAFQDKQAGVVVTAAYAHSLAFFPSRAMPWLSNRLSPAYTVTQLKS